VSAWLARTRRRNGAHGAAARSRSAVPATRSACLSGTDPISGERLRLHGTARTEREAEKLRTKLLAEADAVRSASTNASLGYLLDRWLPQHDVDENTRESYESLIRVHIRPALGAVPLTMLVRKGTETVEQFYGSLQRCRDRCDGRRLTDHKTDGAHECAEAGCRPHVCRPLAATTVCRTHAVLSAACRTGHRWGWRPFNPMDAVPQPRKPKPNPRAADAGQHSADGEAATRQDPEWGLARRCYRRSPRRDVRAEVEPSGPGRRRDEDRTELRPREHGAVLAGVKATP